MTHSNTLLMNSGPVYMIPVYVPVARTSRVYMISVHRDVPGDRDVSISLKKAWKS